MKDFSATDVAIEGFMLAGRKPGAVLTWSLAQLVVNVFLGVVVILLIGQDMQLIASPDSAGSWSEPGMRGRMFAALFRVQSLYALGALGGGAVQSCAVYRACRRPEEKGLGYFKFGRDELRMVGLNLLYLLLWLGAYVALIVWFVVAIIVAGIVAAGMDKGPAQTALVVLLSVIGMVGPVLAVGWVLVRLSLSGPMTFALRKVQLWPSWKLTRGHVWALSGAYLISLVLALAGMVVGSCLALLIGLLITHQGLGGLYQMAFRPDYQSIAAFFSPERLVVLAGNALFMGLVMAVWYSPAAEAYRMLAAPEPAAAPPPSDDAPVRKGPWG